MKEGVEVGDTPQGAVLSIRVIPRAGRTAVAGTREGALLVRLAAAPVDGAANDALMRLLAQTLGVAPSALRFVSGDRGRLKRVAIAGLTAADVTGRLRAAISRSDRRPSRA